jgi:hypothetical protein
MHQDQRRKTQARSFREEIIDRIIVLSTVLNIVPTIALSTVPITDRIIAPTIVQTTVLTIALITALITVLTTALSIVQIIVLSIVQIIASIIVPTTVRSIVLTTAPKAGWKLAQTTAMTDDIPRMTVGMITGTTIEKTSGVTKDILMPAVVLLTRDRTPGSNARNGLNGCLNDDLNRRVW